jgi:hypothetical protein
MQDPTNALSKILTQLPIATRPNNDKLLAYLDTDLMDIEEPISVLSINDIDDPNCTFPKTERPDDNLYKFLVLILLPIIKKSIALMCVPNYTFENMEQLEASLKYDRNDKLLPTASMSKADNVLPNLTNPYALILDEQRVWYRQLTILPKSK